MIVEIKAKSLRWCQYGFEFKDSCGSDFKNCTSNGGPIKSSEPSPLVFTEDEKIFVDSQLFMQSVCKTVEEWFDEVPVSIKKFDGCLVMIRFEYDEHGEPSKLINPDPCPWLYSFKLEKINGKWVLLKNSIKHSV